MCAVRRFLFAWLPFLFISAVIASIFYIATSTVAQLVSAAPFRSGAVYAVYLLAVAYCSRRILKEVWREEYFPARILQYFLVAGGCALILYRSAIYFHVVDDFVYHLPAGFALDDLWLGGSVLRLSSVTYLYPLLQVVFSFVIELVGIRGALLILGMVQLSWLLSLNSRFAALLFPSNYGRRWVVDILFMGIFFNPDLVLTHETFMSDLYTVLFALETTYALLSNAPLAWVGALIVTTILSKQSSGFFLLPLAAFGLAINIRRVALTDVLVTTGIAAAVCVFFGATYYDTGNPFSFLFNGIFASPVYPTGNFRDGRWGPEGINQVLVWPIVGPLSQRWVEFSDSTNLRALHSLFTAIPCLWSIAALVGRYRWLGAVILGSFVLWGNQSGYGRYQVSMTSVAWVLMLFCSRRWIPAVSSTVTLVVLSVIGLSLGMSNFSRDYALRGSPLTGSLSPVFSPQSAHLLKRGANLYGRDKPRRIYRRLSRLFRDVDAIVLVDDFSGGVSTFYAFLGSYFAKIPVLSLRALEADWEQASLDKLSPRLRLNLAAFKERKSVLVVSDNSPMLLAKLESSRLMVDRRCTRLSRGKQVPEFPHENYFGYVVEYECLQVDGVRRAP